MINEFFIWDKISPINGHNVEEVLNSDKSFLNNTVAFFTENNIPRHHALVENLRLELNMPTQTDEEVCQAKLNIIIDEQNRIEKEQLTLEEQAIKISILEAEKEALLESQKIQDRTIVENDMRMMDLEWALEDLILGLNPTAKNINLMEVFNMERSAVYFNQLKQMIEMENYDSKEDMERILNKYASGSRPRITKEEYDQLFDLLYPPVYDISTVQGE